MKFRSLYFAKSNFKWMGLPDFWGRTGWKTWPKLEECPISLGSGKYFSNLFLNAYLGYPINTFLTLNTFPQTIKPAKTEKTVFVDQFQLFPQVWASLSLAILAWYNNTFVLTYIIVHVRVLLSYNNIQGFMKYFIATEQLWIILMSWLFLHQGVCSPHLIPYVWEHEIL